MYWSHEQTDRWRLRWREYRDILSSATYYQNTEQRRHEVQQALAQLLDSFLHEQLSLKAFHTVFLQKTSGSLNVFGLRGLSGGMFFSKLLKCLPDEKILTLRLRTVLRLPRDMQDGRRRMQEFIGFLEDLITSQLVTRAQIQPARVPFFVSVWWHFQEREQWPIFYPVVHNVLMMEAGYPISPQNVVETYFVFRTCFLSLARQLSLTSWELEQVAYWYGQKNLREGIMKGEMPPLLLEHKKWILFQKNASTQMMQEEGKNTHGAVSSGTNNVALQQKQEEISHTYVQWLLAKIGLKVGCRVWIAVNDHHKVWQQDCLGTLSLKSLPAFEKSQFHSIISQIDVMWFWRDEVVAAYEIRETKDISTGLLRLYDLGTLVPNHNLQLCVVTPKERLRRVQFELTRPVFDRQGIRERCALISEERLVQHGEDILRWAGSPTVIQDLITHLGPGELAE